MDTFAIGKKVKPPRVLLTDQLHQHLIEKIMTGSVAALAKRTGLPYLLIYNIVHKRVLSLSSRHYRIIFGEEPPIQTQKKVDGARFRKMVALWLYLNGNTSKADLYLEFNGPNHTQKVDYRIFSGKIQSVDPRFVQVLENKFAECGINQATILRWIDQFDRQDRQVPIAYERVRPLLLFLNDALGVHPTTLLDQWSQRYESGDLKSVSHKLFAKISMLKTKAEQALASGSRLKIEKLKEEIYGRKPGYTLYAEIEEELTFLQRYAHISPKRYLGRSTSTYAKGESKRLPSWRAQKIIEECRALIRQTPSLPLAALPGAPRKIIVDTLVSVLKARLADLLSHDEGLRFEKQILRPTYANDEYKKRVYGFTRFDLAGNAIGMKKKAFDLMVAKNCEIFRKIGTYAHHWYLSDLYLKELSQKQYFDVITAKYEWLAQKADPAKPTNSCLQ